MFGPVFVRRDKKPLSKKAVGNRNLIIGTPQATNFRPRSPRDPIRQGNLTNGWDEDE